MRIEFTKRFLKKYPKLQPQQRRKVDSAIRLFVREPWHASLRRHTLRGEYMGHFSINAGFDLRVIALDLGEEVVYIIDVGTHNQLYG